MQPTQSIHEVNVPLRIFIQLSPPPNLPHKGGGKHPELQKLLPPLVGGIEGGGCGRACNDAEGQRWMFEKVGAPKKSPGDFCGAVFT